MAVSTSCPQGDSLQQFVLGQMSPEAVEPIALHLEQCPSCIARLQSLSLDDTLVGGITRQETSEEMLREPAVEALIDRLKRMQTVPSSAGTREFTGEAASSSLEGTDIEKIDFLDPPQSADEIGRLGDYRILQELGRGGMGMVFLAEEIALKRQVALKVVRRKAAGNDDNRRRFIREAQATAALDHDNIVTIFAVGEANGVPYIAMPLLKGMSLDEMLAQQSKLTLPQIIHIGRQIAEGLAEAHGTGLVHRDIKPANIWIEPGAGGRVKILDFGLARDVDDDVQITGSGHIVGTPAYMSPEQGRGEATDQRSDLFSLGVVLYRLATGDLPFRGKNTMAVLTSLAADEPPSPQEINADIPAPLNDLIVHLLNKDAAQRPASANEVAHTLQMIESNCTVDAPSDHTAAMTAPVPKRSHLLRYVAIAACLLFAAIISYAALQTIQGTYRTPHGDFFVEINSPKIEAQFKNGKILVYDNNGELRYTLSARKRNEKVEPGKYTIRVVGADGLAVDTDEFTMGDRGSVTARVVLKAPAIAKKVSPDRRAAEYVLSIGGTVRVNGETRRPIRTVADLPKGEFRLTTVGLEYNKKASDKAFAIFKDCDNLRVLNLEGTSISDAGLIHFKNCTRLTGLVLTGTKAGDVGLAYFKDCKQLNDLLIGAAAVTDVGLANFTGLKNIRQLDLSGTRVSGSGLAHFSRCDDLVVVNLADSLVNDAGLVHLMKCRRLAVVDLRGTKVTATGVAELRKVFRRSRIEWDGTAKADRNGGAVKK